MRQLPVHNITSLPKHPSSHAVEAPLFENGQTVNRPNVKRPNYALRRAMVAGTLVLAALGIGDGLKTLHDHNEIKPIDLTSEHNEYAAREGDTLFGIAEKAEPNQDPRKVETSIEMTIAKRDNVSQAEAADIFPGEDIPLPDGAHLGDKVPGDTSEQPR